jgi:hypothetical protein
MVPCPSTPTVGHPVHRADAAPGTTPRERQVTAS